MGLGASVYYPQQAITFAQVSETQEARMLFIPASVHLGAPLA